MKNCRNFEGISPGCSVSQTPTWVIEVLNVGKQTASYQSPDVLIEALLGGFPIEPLMPCLLSWIATLKSPLCMYLCRYLKGALPDWRGQSPLDEFPCAAPWNAFSGPRPKSRRRRKRITNKQHSLAWVSLQFGVLSLAATGWQQAKNS